MERKLVTIRKIADINPIPGADAIEVATVDGWKLVVKKGEFKPGDLCVYFEIDSFLPESDPRYSFLMKSGVREFEGVRGHKLRTVKLRGQISQGLALPVPLFYADFDESFEDEGQELSEFFREGQELTKLLGIKKYEAPIPAALAGQVKGGFPFFIKKTDQERCQNIVKEIFEDNATSKYEITTKLDGTSVTYYHREGEVGVCSRNLELKINEENKDNSLVKMFVESGLIDAIKAFGNVAIQGELMGPGIQGNREALKTHKFFVFDIQDLDTGTYFWPIERHEMMSRLSKYGVSSDYIAHVPIMFYNDSLDMHGITNVDQLLAFAEGPSINHAVREGLVFKRHDGEFSFKAISNSFLAKEKD